ncbi:hypothetical protein EW146_g9149 [Bondarzewia mesenterica]|uniref:Uncharacterized protein n=1 Tax=Bondarzewia mesenterica TaxID=1095465 RepID=A0A4S4LAJ5_9AGAM|nr:hypothetical protein EW146_g9149 [Bondarzewia mesenterica]
MSSTVQATYHIATYIQAALAAHQAGMIGDLGEDLWWELTDDALLSPLYPIEEDIELMSPLHVLSNIEPDTDT